MLRRFFMYCAYNGRYYNGAAFLRSRNAVPVSNVLLDCLRKVQPELELTDIQISSRTDQGVNALCNVMHFNTKYLGDINPTWLRAETNNILRNNKDDIRIHFIREVDPKRFHSRFNATGRTYLYRISAYEDLPATVIYNRPLNLIPFFPWQPVQGWTIPGPLDVDRMQEVAGLLHNVEHDYTGFTNLKGLLDNDSGPVRTCSLELTEVQHENQFLERLHPAFKLPFKHYDIRIHSRSFLYKMIRFIGGCLVSVGQHQMTIDDVKHVLSNGAEYLQDKPFVCGLPSSLFLVNVDYDDPSLELTYEDISKEMHTFIGKHQSPIKQDDKQIESAEKCAETSN